MKARRSPSSTLTAYLFLTPALLGLFFLTIFPMIGVILISLTNWSGLEPPKFIGLENFREIFTTDVYFLKSVVATLYFALGAVISGIDLLIFHCAHAEPPHFCPGFLALGLLHSLRCTSHWLGGGLVMAVRGELRSAQLRPPPPGHE